MTNEFEAIQEIQKLIAAKRGVDDRFKCARCGVHVACEWHFSYGGDSWHSKPQAEPKIWPANHEIKGWSILLGADQNRMFSNELSSAVQGGARLLCPSCGQRSIRKPGEKKTKETAAP